MRLRTIYKIALIIGTAFCVAYLILYLNAGIKEEIHVDPAKELNSLLSGKDFEMAWLKDSKQQQSKSVPKRIGISRKPDLNMSNILEELRFDNIPGGVWTQGFPIEVNMDVWADRPLEVFIVPHSHQDPGWIMTFDEYFSQQTKPCLDATLKVLRQHSTARFTYAEISFFSQWVHGLSDEEKRQVRELLFSGRLEIASGGWVMTDEATVDYYGMLDQLVEGHHWLLETFGYLPNTSWSIDPFGQSTTMAYLVRQMQFSGMIINRVHYEVKKYFAQRRSLEFRWRQSWDNDGQSEILTHMLPFYAYDIPHTCGPDPSICCQFDFLRTEAFFCPWKKFPQLITDKNLEVQANLLADQYRKKASLYDNTGLLFVPLGDDFRYLSEHEWHLQLDNYDKIIQYFDAHPVHRIRLRFATVSDYFEALHERLGTRPGQLRLSDPKPPQFLGDLFTYADKDKEFWSGYFTTRPYQKSLVRQLEYELRPTEIIYSYARAYLAKNIKTKDLLSILIGLYPKLQSARRNLGLFHHHDGITGTAKTHVVTDYSTRLISAIRAARVVRSTASALLLLLVAPNTQNMLSSNHRLLIPAEMRTQLAGLPIHVEQFLAEAVATPDFLPLEDSFVMHQHAIPQHILLESKEVTNYVYLFNPIVHQRRLPVELTIKGAHSNLKVTDMSSGNTLPVQVVKVQPNGELTTVLIGPITTGPLSFQRLSILSTTQSVQEGRLLAPGGFEELSEFTTDQLILKSPAVKLHFNPQNGLLSHYEDLLAGFKITLNISFVTYKTFNGKKHSGAYIFIPDGPEKVLTIPDTALVRVVHGPLFDELTLCAPFVNHTVRLYKNVRDPAEAIEIENVVDLSMEKNLELVMRIGTNLRASRRNFFTDSNCFQFINRTFYDKLSISGNLYPMTCASFVQGHLNKQSEWFRLNLLTAHSLGVTSTEVGSLSVWLDRRAHLDDERGLGQSLTGKWITKSLFNILVERMAQQPAAMDNDVVPRLTRPAYLALTNLIRPIQRFSVTNTKWATQMPDQVSLSSGTSLPMDYDLVNLKTFNTEAAAFRAMNAGDSQLGLFLHRLPPFADRLDGKDKAAVTSATDNVNIERLFSLVNLRSAAKTKRLTLIPEPDEQFTWQSAIRLKPMELNAFVLR